MENKLKAIMDDAPLSILMLNKQLEVVECSSNWLARYNFKREDVLNKPISELLPNMPDNWHEIQRRTLQGESFRSKRDSRQFKPGTTDYVRWICQPYRLKNGEIDGIVIFSEVITEQVSNNNKLLKVNRELTLLNNIKEVISNAQDDSELMDGICQEIANDARYCLCWIGYAPNLLKEQQLIKPVSKHGTKIQYLENFKIDMSNPNHRNGPAVTALHTGKMVVVNDIAENAAMVSWRENALKHGINSGVAIPMSFDNDQECVMLIYSEEKDAFDADEIDALQKICLWITISVNNIYNIQQRKVLHISQTKLISDLNKRNNSLEEFTYLVSHNIRAKVASILGVSKLFVDQDLETSELKEMMFSVYQNAKRLDEVIRDLNKTLLVKDHYIINNEMVSLTEIQQSVNRKLESIFKDRKLDIQTDFSAIDQFHTDGYYFFEALFQLIYSLVKQNSAEDITIGIKSRRHKNKIDIVLIDNVLIGGLQLSKGREDIFEVYSRHYQHSSAGSIKLFYVKGIIDTLGGTLKIAENEENMISFIIELPV